VTSARRLSTPTLLLPVLLLAGAIWILYIARDAQFWSDDFAFVVFRQGHAPHILLGSFNGHFAFFPVVAYKVLLALFGMHHYWPYRLAVLVVHVAALTLVYAYTRRRIGDWAALACVALLVIYGAAVELYVYPVNLGFQLAIATGLGALLLLDEPTTRRRAIWATVLLTIGIASSTVALPFALAAIVDVARRPAERRALWWVPAIPLGVYVLWSLKYGDGQLVMRNTGQVWDYTMGGIARSTAGLFALDESWGQAIAVVTLLAVLWRASRVDRLTALVAGLFGFWALTAMARAQLGTEGADRFLYPSAVLLVVIWAEAARGLRIPLRLAVVLPFAVAGIVVANGFTSFSSAKTISGIGQTTSGALRALALVAPDTTSAVVPPLPVYGASARQLAAAVRKFGTPGGSPSSLNHASGPARVGADAMLRAIATPAGAPSPDGIGAPGPLSSADAVARTRGGCLVVTPTAATTLQVQIPATGLTVRNDGAAPVTVATRRFAGFGAPDVSVAPGGATQLHLTAAPGAPPWVAQLGASTPFRVCTPSR
jgi:hypothetical protein